MMPRTAPDVDARREVAVRLELADLALARGDLETAALHLAWAIHWHEKSRP